MKKLAAIASLFVAALVLPLSVTPSSAKEKAAKPEATASATPATTATPKPKKPSFFERLNPFRKREKASATPATSSSPTSASKGKVNSAETPEPEKTPAKKRSRNSAKSTPKPEEKSTPKPRRKPTPEPETTPEPKATPAPESVNPTGTPDTGLNTPLPFTPESGKPQATPAATPVFAAGLDEEAITKARYRAVKNQALQDKKILALQDKADAARDEDSQRSLTKAYYRALFDKMRELDPSLKSHIDGVEAATMKRLQSMTASQSDE